MKNIFIILGLFLLISIAANSASALPISGSFGGHDYVVILKPGGLSWSEASNDLTARYGSNWHLATISSSEEESFIENLIQANTVVSSREQYWLGGLKDLSSSSNQKWDWVNNEGTFWNSGDVTGVYSNFWQGEPNNYRNRNEDWLALDYRVSANDWKFNDEALSSNVKGYIGESLPVNNSAIQTHVPVPEPATLTLFGAALICLSGFSSRKFRKR